MSPLKPIRLTGEAKTIGQILDDEPMAQYDAGVPTDAPQGSPFQTVRGMRRYGRKIPPPTAPKHGPQDMVDLPDHYARYKIEPVHFAMENGLDPFQFNILKYSVRWDAKNGLEDLRKTLRYAEMYYKFANGDPDWAGPSTLTIGGPYGYGPKE